MIIDTEGRTVTIAGINGEVYSEGEGERTVRAERCSLTESAGEAAAYSEATRGEVLLMLWRLENEPEATAEGTAALKWLCGAGVLPAEEASAQSTPMALLMARLAENVK